ncbi:MAG: sugar kinase [Solirubrobacterales bacterium]|jgi:sugar/nucleoside kinase (ribokinase family)|nr:sugar kinase [Solirubrobacterales bacterium]
MSLTVVGSIAFDAVKTPSGERERMLGGAATHFALAASFFDEVRVVGPVGDDFDEASWATLRTRGVNTDDVEHVAGGKTFFWKGVYGDNLNSRETLETELNVFEHFEPKLSQAAQDCDVLFLANIVPDLQYGVLQQCTKARFTALDSMDLWINIARESLEKTIRAVDCLILNDEELEMLTGAPTTLAAAEQILGWGLKAVVAKQGKYGAQLFTPEGTFALPAFPLGAVADPTGAGDSFAGGFVGSIAARNGGEVTHDVLVRAMAYGTAVASFNVEEFGTERVARLTGAEVEERVKVLEQITALTGEPVALRA